MRFVFNLLNLLTFLLVMAVLFNLPVVVAGFLVRKRFDRRYIRGALALGFAASTAYWQWRFEWFDVWRHGLPSIGYLLTYVPYTAASALVGWFIGGLIARPPRRRLAPATNQRQPRLAACLAEAEGEGGTTD